VPVAAVLAPAAPVTPDLAAADASVSTGAETLDARGGSL
jgi:hypothetical protein